MAAGVRGRLISAGFADTVLPTLPGFEAPPAAATHALEAWSERRETALGPASSVRAIADVALVPLLKILGYAIEHRVDEPARVILDAVTPSRVLVPVVVVPWNESLEPAWRGAVLEGVRTDARWCFCSNGTALRVVDGHHTWSRQYVEFELAVACCD